MPRQKQRRVQNTKTLYLERPGCNLCMGNQEKAAKGDTVLATSTRLFKGRVVEDTPESGESLMASTPVVVLSAILGRTPSVEEYKSAVEGIDLTKFAPPKTTPIDSLSVHQVNLSPKTKARILRAFFYCNMHCGFLVGLNTVLP